MALQRPRTDENGGKHGRGIALIGLKEPPKVKCEYRVSNTPREVHLHKKIRSQKSPQGKQALKEKNCLPTSSISGGREQSSTPAKMAFGDYPKEYNPAVHGPYDPARYYGKKDIPLAQVKLSELGEWFSRRNKSPQSMVAACSRAWWRWQHKYTMPKKGTMAPIYQVVAVSMVAFYIFNYPKITAHRKAKYH